MTTYGTILTSSSAAVPNLEFISRAKERLNSGLATPLPWKDMLNLHSISLPATLNEALGRITTNLTFFRTNYAIFVLFLLFLSLLWQPISLIVFIITMAAWLFLYFLRDDPLLIFNHTIDDRVVLIVLSVLTILLLLFTHATANILISVFVGVVLVLIHAALMKIDDLFLDEEADGASVSFVGVSSSSS
ncbi:hypothetical protein CsSME_00007675 [Camellia sinensis var. sinensis]|uniref:PRA1 family protein n=2 Tax=Camellia sinensis TaxID=4442 RepID=A0A7J7HWH3_CAMSI|nr:PRA1 family protein F2-like [Camellia sinensis]KAF5956999.1 hypothetical protein HYC85_004224 [Camellia sinensis]THG02541.1 hypothetical protein TEA_015400 [Camellia sinensis var. sinensis]